MKKVESSDWTGAIFAAAGLERIGLRPVNAISLNWMLPAPAQGALAVECRAADLETAWYGPAMKSLDCREARAAAAAERSLLATLEAGCIAPVGAYAAVADGTLTLRAAVIAVDGASLVAGELSGPIDDAAAIGRDLALELLSRGAAGLLGAAR